MVGAARVRGLPNRAEYDWPYPGLRTSGNGISGGPDVGIFPCVILRNPQHDPRSHARTRCQHTVVRHQMPAGMAAEMG